MWVPMLHTVGETMGETMPNYKDETGIDLMLFCSDFVRGSPEFHEPYYPNLLHPLHPSGSGSTLCHLRLSRLQYNGAQGRSNVNPAILNFAPSRPFPALVRRRTPPNRRQPHDITMLITPTSHRTAPAKATAPALELVLIFFFHGTFNIWRIPISSLPSFPARSPAYPWLACIRAAGFTFVAGLRRHKATIPSPRAPS